MIIEKNGKTYTITELQNKWNVKTNSGKLSATYEVSKELCPTIDALQEYVLNNDNLF